MKRSTTMLSTCLALSTAAAVAKKDRAAAAAHVPADGQVAFTLNVPDGTSKETWKQSDVAEGKADTPGCGPIPTRPSCDEAATPEGMFQCRCDGGGYHVTHSDRTPAESNGLAALTAVQSEEL